MSKSICRDIGLYKNRLISAFLNSDDIVSLLLNKKTYTEDEVDSLIYTQVFPYLYIDKTQTGTLSYLCFEVNIPRLPTGTMKRMELVIWAYCSKAIMKYHKKNYLGTRVDILADMVERSLGNSDRFGIGKVSMERVNNFFPHGDYYGREIVFSMPDFRVKECL